MGFEVLRTNNDLSEITALDRSAIAHWYHNLQFSLMYTLKWIEKRLRVLDASAPLNGPFFYFCNALART